MFFKIFKNASSHNNKYRKILKKVTCFILTLVFVIPFKQVAYAELGDGESEADVIRFVAIGNSITLTPGVLDDGTNWWNNCGMAASEPSKDWVRMLAELLSINRTRHVIFESQYIGGNTFGEIEFKKQLIYEKLNPNIDLVTYELTENLLHDVKNLMVMNDVFTDLIDRTKEKAPNAQIILIGSFWDRRDTTEPLLKLIAQFNNVSYVSLEVLWNNPPFKSHIGAQILGRDGQMHSVDSQGVADHPNDYGHAYIANAVYMEFLKHHPHGY